MPIETLYALCQTELAKDLIFEVEGEPVTFSIKGVLMARTSSRGYNFSFFEISETEIALAVKMKGFVVYIGIETDENIEEELYPEVVRALLENLSPQVVLLVTKAEENYRGRADLLLDDDMSPALKEFFYQLLIKHRHGESPYEQTEVA